MVRRKLQKVSSSIAYNRALDIMAERELPLTDQTQGMLVMIACQHSQYR